MREPDPVESLATNIEWAPLESVQLFSGFRGTGKSTTLRRLKALLEERGCIVALCDMQDYLNLSTPIDISDFLISVAGAFGDALRDREHLGSDPAHEGYWTRFVNFLTKTRVELSGVDVKTDAGATLKTSLKQDPSFRQQLQERMKGHIGQLVEDVRQYMADCITRLRSRFGADKRVVLLLDSVEQIRGTSINADEVYSSVETLFVGHAGKLKFEYLHVVYTTPPWLKIRHAGVYGSFDDGYLLPCVKVQTREGRPYSPGLNALEQVVRKRGDWQRLVGSRAQLDKLILASGGYLRDLFRLLQACLRLANGQQLPIKNSALDRGIVQVRNSYLPIALEDARWLAKTASSNDANLESMEKLPDLSRLFDTHMLLCYRNGEEWYGIHPIIRERVLEMNAREQAERDRS